LCYGAGTGNLVVTNLAVAALAGFPTKRNSDGPLIGDQALDTEALAARPDQRLSAASTLRPCHAVAGDMATAIADGQPLGPQRPGKAALFHHWHGRRRPWRLGVMLVANGSPLGPRWPPRPPQWASAVLVATLGFHASHAFRQAESRVNMKM
jgi:hypothetical protein